MTRTDTEQAYQLAAKLAVMTAGTPAASVATRLRKLLSPPPSMKEILLKVPGDSDVARAKAIGVSRQGYYNWLRGDSVPNELSAKRIAELTGYSEDVIRGL